MTGIVEARLKNSGIEIMQAPVPVANYIPFTISGNFVFVSGQGTLLDGELRYIGKLGRDFTVEDGYQAARLCAVNVLAQLRAACDGDLDRVTRVLRIGGFVNSMPDFTAQPKVVNGASDLFVEVFGEIGRHARTAVGVPTLPDDIAVEVDAFFEIRG